MKQILENIHLKDILKSKKHKIILIIVLIIILLMPLFKFILDGYETSKQYTFYLTGYNFPKYKSVKLNDNITVTYEKVGDLDLPLPLFSYKLLLENGDILFFSNYYLQLYNHKTKQFNLLYLDKFEDTVFFLDNKIFIPYIDIYFDFKNLGIYQLPRKEINKYFNLKQVKNILSLDKKVDTLFNQNKPGKFNKYINDYCFLTNFNPNSGLCGEKFFGFDFSSSSLVSVNNEKLLIIGGYDGNKTLNTIKLYDSKTKQISIIGYMKFARMYSQSVLMQKDKVLIVGGYFDSKNGDELNNAEIFDLKTSNIKLFKPIFNYRPISYQLTLLKNGKVLISGNVNGIFDPEKNLYYPIKNISILDGYKNNITVLNNAQILITGGDIRPRPSDGPCFKNKDYKTSILVTIMDKK